jgi:hypothetical protein
LRAKCAEAIGSRARRMVVVVGIVVVMMAACCVVADDLVEAKGDGQRWASRLQRRNCEKIGKSV